MIFCCVTLQRTVPELWACEKLFLLNLTPLAAFVCGVWRRAAAKCVFSTFLWFKKFCIRHVTYQKSAFFKLYTMVQVSSLVGSKKTQNLKPSQSQGESSLKITKYEQCRLIEYEPYMKICNFKFRKVRNKSWYIYGEGRGDTRIICGKGL